MTCKGFCRIFFLYFTHTHKNASYQNTFLFMRFLLPARPLTPRLSSSVITQPEIEVWWFWAVFFTGAVKKKKKEGWKKKIKITTATPPCQPSLHQQREFHPLLEIKTASISSCCDCLLFRMCCVRCCSVQLLQPDGVDLLLHTHAHTLLLSIVHTKTCTFLTPGGGERTLSSSFGFYFIFFKESTGDDFMHRTVIMLTAVR